MNRPNPHNRFAVRVLLIVAALVLASCSVQKNTKVSRFHHQLNTRYNVYFNANNAYQDGLKKMAEANKDDFSKVLPIYPVSNHENIQAASSDMTTSMEKCRKSIKLHSIKKKPKYNSSKMSDPAYKAWYNQEEFNKELWKAWLLLGQSEFHKGEFLGAVSTFNYITRHYAYDNNVVAQCRLWSARAYGELGWLYEADQVLQSVNQDQLNRKSSDLFAVTEADLLLKQERYPEAIPFLQLAVGNEKDKQQRGRLWFILGQLQDHAGRRIDAADAYRRVLKSNPTVEMDFNARINMTRLSATDKDLKMLQKMTRQYKHKDHLDQVYGTIGDIYLSRGDTLRALENYQLGIDTMRTSSSKSKGALLVKTGDLYYLLQRYDHAQPCYSGAVGIVSSEDPDFERVSRRAEVLGELIQEQNKVTLQDSLQRLASMSEEEQLAVITKMLADKAAAEQAAAERARQDSANAANGLQSVNRTGMIGGGSGSAEWYFYNTSLKQQGKTEFMRKWGNRQNEDNWRYANKSVSNPLAAGGSEEDNLTPDSNDSLPANQPPAVTDPADPRYYLADIPSTPEQMASSNREIASALYNMGYIYKDKVEDTVQAMRTFDELERRFPTDSTLLDVYYVRYLTALQQHDSLLAEQWRLALIQKYPDTKQAQMLSMPNYAERIREMNQRQDSLYEQTYKDYLAANYQGVFSSVTAAETNYPLSPLMPRFLFLRALATGKAQDENAFGDALRDMIQRYPQAEVSAMAKDMLAMMNQGLETQTGSSHGSLVELREEADEDSTAAVEFSPELNTQFVILLVMKSDPAALNELLYRVAFYNFSQFMIKDFDLAALANYGTDISVLRISGFSSYKEAAWYLDKIHTDGDVSALLHRHHVQEIPISSANEPLLQQTSVRQYLDWWKELGVSN